MKQMTHNINTSTGSITKYSFQRRDGDYSQEIFKTFVESKTEPIANLFFLSQPERSFDYKELKELVGAKRSFVNTFLSPLLDSS